MVNQEVYAACKKFVDDDKGYEALACLSKMLEERNTEIKIMANHRLVVLDTVKKFARVDNPSTKKHLCNRLEVIGNLVEDE